MRKMITTIMLAIFLLASTFSPCIAGGREKAGAGFVVFGSTLAIIGVIIRQEKEYFLTEEYLSENQFGRTMLGEELPYEKGNAGISNGLIVMGIISAMVGTVVALTGDDEEGLQGSQWQDRLEIDSDKGIRLAYKW